LGGDITWVPLLKKIRDLFAHDAASGLATRVKKIALWIANEIAAIEQEHLAEQGG